MAVMHVSDGAAMPQGGSARGAAEAVDAVASVSLSQPAKPRRVSVVVPTYKRPELLLNCLRALLAQTLPPEDWEVLIVDDGHDGETRRAVAVLAAQHPHNTLRYLRPAVGRGPAVARNVGWRAAASPLIAFTDDDTLPQPDWLAEGVRKLESDLACWALAGRVKVPRPGKRDAPPTDHELMTRGLETGSFVTANAFVRRDALQRVGGFDEAFKRAWREDSDLEFCLERAAGRSRLRRCETAVVLHPVRPERWGVSLRQQKNVFYDALLYRKHPRLYRQRIQAQPPWNYFVIVAATLAVLPLLLIGQATAAAMAGGLALSLVLA
ncbi:MAG TPA: glycosyltransferase, partial [Rubrivivax sp.]|nr:glycosyltransferase [Rubrivivax sp.]